MFLKYIIVFTIFTTIIGQRTFLNSNVTSLYQYIQIYMMGNIVYKNHKFMHYKFPEVVKTQRPSTLRIKPENIPKGIEKTFIQVQPTQVYEFKTKQQSTDFQVYDLPEKISVVTYNIWFQNNNMEKRNSCIMKMLEQSQADFICLQQVTKAFRDLLHSGKWGWVNDYYMGVFMMNWYDTIILSKYKCRFTKAPFKSSHMQRSMTFAELIGSKGENIVVGCMHYESLNTTQQRIKQIKMVQDKTSQCKRVIIAGDYNFSDKFPENDVIQKSYTDLWIKTRNGDLKGSQTMPKNPKFSAWRPDHVLCKMPGDLQGAKIDKIGDFNIPPFQKDDFNAIHKDGIVRTPSDHYGLYSVIPVAKIEK